MVGSNILDSIKHCVAIGGAVTAAVGVAPGTPVAAAVAAGPPSTAGGAGVMFNAFAATGGSSNPVPTIQQSIIYSSYTDIHIL